MTLLPGKSISKLGARSFGPSVLLRLTVVALLASCSAFAQGVALSLSSGSGSPGTAVTVNITLNSSGAQPAAVQWTLNYSRVDFTSATTSAGATATAAGKQVSCNNSSGSSTCVLWGINSKAILNGVVATVALTISASTLNTSSAIQLTNGSAAALDSTALTANASGNAVTIVQTPTTWGLSGTTTGGSGATVTLSGAANATATADASGNYSFTGLANGAYTVTPSKSGFTFSPATRSVNVNSANVSAINFTAQAVPNTWSLSGTFVGGSGATVNLSGAASATATADASGNYSFTGLANGAYTVTPTKSGFSFSPINRAVTISSANVSAINFTASPSGSTSTLSVSNSSLNFGWNGALMTSAQTVLVNTTPAAAVAWTATSSQSNIVVTPPSGVGSGALQIAVNPGPSGVVTVTAAGATNSPRQIQVNVSNVTPGSLSGSFDTPLNNTSGIAGAIAVTGWALDNIEVTSVGIWREPMGGEPTNPNGLVFIGNATFVPGARPDVQTGFPNSPWSYRGGWGYLLLTNFLPNPGGPLGNGTYRLHAIAVNKAGNQLDLGTRIINVDNAHASKPFGTIDTPDQGGTASGNAFVNFGWALTPNPYLIPLDGSTISVLLDGVTLGHPNYNQYRADVATDFPGLANSNGAVGFFYIDTTKLANGMHTLAWVVTDNGNHVDGIGSRYFNVLNSGLGGTAAPAETEPVVSMEGANQALRLNQQAAPLVMDDNGTVSIDVEELSRIELPLGATSAYLLMGGERTALPIGSTLQKGVFYWQLGPGFLGDYSMVFERPDGIELRVRVSIQPKHSDLAHRR